MCVMRWLIGAVASGSVALFASCADETVSEPTPLGPRDQFAKDLGAVICEGLYPCCESTGFGDPVEHCPGSMRNHTMEAILDAEQQHRSLLLENDTATCLETFRVGLEEAPSCGSLPHPRNLTALCPELFGPIPEGDKAPGELCSFTYECSAPEDSERQCYQRDFNTDARCTWFVPTAGGEPCLDEPGTIHVCEGELGCGPDPETAELVCGDPPDFGDPCTLSNGCDGGLICVGSAEVEGGFECVDSLALGSACLQAPDACGGELFCDLETGACTELPFNTACNGGPCPSVNLQANCR